MNGSNMRFVQSALLNLNFSLPSAIAGLLCCGWGGVEGHDVFRVVAFNLSGIKAAAKVNDTSKKRKTK